MSRPNQSQPDFFNQGKQLLNNINQKIQEGFENIKGDNYKNGANYREGFYGVSSTDIDASINILNAADNARLAAAKGTFDSYTTALSSAKQALNTKIGSYAANMKDNINYNLFSNRLLDYSDISMNGSGQCINSSLLTQSNSGFTMDPRFNTAYPTPAGIGSVNFASFNDAKNACQTWAYDDKKQLFGLTKRTGGGYNCYTSNAAPSVQPAYITEKVAYTVASSYDANFGGLFSNGQIGVYNGKLTGSNTVFVDGNSGVASCDIWNGGGINPYTITASYGRNCNNVGSSNPQKVQYIIISPGSEAKNIQISQIAVYAYVKGSSVNVAIKTAASHPSYSVKTKNGTGAEVSNLANALTAVDGVLATKSPPNCYLSTTNTTTNYWKLNLGKDYEVYRVVYYNRGDCCQTQAYGMTIRLQNSAETNVAVYTLNSDRVQPFTVDKSITLAPIIAPTGTEISYTMLDTSGLNRIYSTVFGMNGLRDILGGNITNGNGNSRINSIGGWLSLPTSQPLQLASAQTSTPNQYIILDFQTAKNIAGIVIQPHYDIGTQRYVKSFKVQYWDLTATPPVWKYVTANGMTDGESNEFTGILPAENRSDIKKFVPFGIDGRTSTNLPLTYNTTKLKIIPIDWNNAIAMRVDAIVISP